VESKEGRGRGEKRENKRGERRKKRVEEKKGIGR
jgi:hypothetical protein